MYNGFSTLQTFIVWREIQHTNCKDKIKQGMTLFSFETWLNQFIENSTSIANSMGVNTIELYFAFA